MITINKEVLHRQFKNRFIELDIFRGLAIALMIFGHFLWDLDYFGIAPINSIIYIQLQRTVPPLFFLLVGICLAVSVNKKNHIKLDEKKKYRNHLLQRGVKIFCYGVVLTIVTMLFMPDRPILFGVLQCIGLSIIISVIFLRFKIYNVFIGLLFLLISIPISQFVVAKPTILHLAVGLHQANYWEYTIDYFPLLPWFGVVLIGLGLGNILYKDNKRRFNFPDLSQNKPVTIFSWLGRHSLAVYLLHQPVIAGALSLFLIL
jgi:uncharacterized membrane protein